MSLRQFHNGLLTGLSLVTLSLLLISCGGQANGSNGEVADEQVSEPEVLAIPVETDIVEFGEVSAAYSGTATLEPEASAVVVSKNTGVVLEILVEEGDVVKQGQVLARLESDRFELELQRNKATMERMDNALKRAEELYSRKLMSSDEYDAARFDAQSQKALYDIAELDLKHAQILAPISGVVSQRLIKVGNLITQHEPVFQIDDFDPLLAVLHVPERELNLLRTNLPVNMTVDAFPDTTFAGDVLRISPVIDPETGTFKITAQITDDLGVLKSGLFGRLQIIYDTHAGATLVNKSAVLSEDGNHTVFVLTDEQKVTRKTIELGFEQHGMLEVLTGLQPGEVVVTAGKASLQEGALVAVIES